MCIRDRHIRANGLTEQITTRLSNGLEAIHDGEVDSIVIAGMGDVYKRQQYATTKFHEYCVPVAWEIDGY